MTELPHLADLQDFPLWVHNLFPHAILTSTEWAGKNPGPEEDSSLRLCSSVWWFPVISMLTVTATHQALCRWPRCQAAGVATLFVHIQASHCPLLAGSAMRARWIVQCKRHKGKQVCYLCEKITGLGSFGTRLLWKPDSGLQKSTTLILSGIHPSSEGHGRLELIPADIGARGGVRPGRVASPSPGRQPSTLTFTLTGLIPDTNYRNLRCLWTVREEEPWGNTRRHLENVQTPRTLLLRQCSSLHHRAAWILSLRHKLKFPNPFQQHSCLINELKAEVDRMEWRLHSISLPPWILELFFLMLLYFHFTTHTHRNNFAA